MVTHGTKWWLVMKQMVTDCTNQLSVVPKVITQRTNLWYCGELSWKYESELPSFFLNPLFFTASLRQS